MKSIRSLVLMSGLFLTMPLCMGQPLDSVCIVTVRYADDTLRVDTVNITYYDINGLKNEVFHWFKGEKVPVHYSYVYDRKGRLKIQETHFHDKDRSKFRYRHGRLYSVTDYDMSTRGKWKKASVTIWEYDKQGRVSRVSNPPHGYQNYARTFMYDTLGRRTMQVNLDEYGRVVYRSRTYYDVQDWSPLMTELETDSLSAIEVKNSNEHGWVVEYYELTKGKINSHLQYFYDESGRLRKAIGLHSTTWYEYGRMPRRENALR